MFIGLRFCRCKVPVRMGGMGLASGLAVPMAFATLRSVDIGYSVGKAAAIIRCRQRIKQQTVEHRRMQQRKLAA